MKKIKITSSTWAGTKTEEEFTFEELGIPEDTSMEDINSDPDLREDLMNIALQQQHFNWSYNIEED